MAEKRRTEVRQKGCKASGVGLGWVLPWKAKDSKPWLRDELRHRCFSALQNVPFCGLGIDSKLFTSSTFFPRFQSYTFLIANPALHSDLSLPQVQVRNPSKFAVHIYVICGNLLDLHGEKQKDQIFFPASQVQYRNLTRFL